MKLAVSFTNFGPYHLARLRAAAAGLAGAGARLIAYETASAERLYPWRVERRAEPFEWVTLHRGRGIEDLPGMSCAVAIEERLERDRPDAVAVAGYVRPEAMAAARWARRTGRPAILMSESQASDRPRHWWKEAVKRRRLRLFDAALVGGPSHRDYLVALGMPAHRIAMGYNAVDHEWFARRARIERARAEPPRYLPAAPYFLCVGRFATEKNLPALVRAFASYRSRAADPGAWDLVLCGGGPEGAAVDEAVQASGRGASIHRPGFLQAEQLTPWYAHASAFVLPSVSEPWGLVVNEAAASGLPLLVSERAGAAPTMVPEPAGTTGRRFDPADEGAIADALGWMASSDADGRRRMGDRARSIASEWGPSRFAEGLREALELAGTSGRPRLALAS